jgi:hemolysin activation/secretion protein
MLLLAQLVAPPLQRGPVRLPEQTPLETPRPGQPKQDESIFGLPGESATPTDQPAAPGQPSPPAGTPQRQLPAVQGQTPYSPEQLQQILGSCGRPTAAATLTACAAALTARLTADGYVNSRVYIAATPAPGALKVVQGRIAELRISSSDNGLAQEIRNRLRGLQGQVLHLPSLERQLVALRSIPGVGQIKGSLGRLGSDPTEAILNLAIAPVPTPWTGDISLRNDGNAGSGEWRAVGVVLKNNLATRGDTFLVYGELNADQDPELGAAITSISYSVPLASRLNLTSSFGYSRRNLIEATGAAHNIAYTQFQGLGQLEWTLKQDINQRWMLFGGFSGNSSSSTLAGASFPLLGGSQGPVPQISTGYLRAGLAYGGNQGPLAWGGNIYGLQGIAGISTSAQLASLASVGIDPGQSRALGGLVSVAWALSDRLQLNGRVAGQFAFNELTNDMGFALGSDVGLKGLPGTFISGDNGYLWTTELVYTVWRNSQQAVQLVPFAGYGGISYQRSGSWTSDTVGSAGALVRWLAGRHWTLELGWLTPIDEGPRVYWNNWLLGSGVYSKIQFRF